MSTDAMKKLLGAMAVALGVDLNNAAPTAKTPEEIAKDTEFARRVEVAKQERRKKILVAAQIKAKVLIDPDLPAGIAGSLLMGMGDKLSFNYHRQRNFFEYLNTQLHAEYAKGTDSPSSLGQLGDLPKGIINEETTGDHPGVLDSRSGVESLETRMRDINDELDLTEVLGEATSILIHKANVDLVEQTGRPAPFRPTFDISEPAYLRFLARDKQNRDKKRETMVEASRQAGDLIRITSVGNSVDRILQAA